MKITPPTQSLPFAVSSTASGTGVSDPGGVFGGLTDVEAILTALVSGSLGAFLTKVGGEVHTLQTLDPMGATSIVDLGNANWFYGTLLANCTLTTTGWTNGSGCYIQVELAGGAGGFIPTLSGVTWVGDPPGVIAAGGVIHVVLYSRDGGSTIWGGTGGGSSDSMVPYLIDVGETFTVPIKKQALYETAITNNGTLVVDGFLIEVS